MDIRQETKEVLVFECVKYCIQSVLDEFFLLLVMFFFLLVCLFSKIDKLTQMDEAERELEEFKR